MQTAIDYLRVFKSLPNPVAVLDAGYHIKDANDCFLEVTGRDLHDIRSRPLFDAFPLNPGEQERSGPLQLRAALDNVMATGKPETLPLLRYDLEDPGRPGVYEQRYWSVCISPLPSQDGEGTRIILWGNEVTPIVSRLQADACTT